MNKLKQWVVCQPFKRKLQWVIMTVVLTTVASTLGFLYWQKNDQQRNDFVRTNLALAKLVAEFTVLPVVFDDSKGAEDQLSKLWKTPNVAYVLLEKTGGQILTNHDPSNIAAAAPTLADNQEWLWQDHYLYFAVPISHEHEKLGILKGAYRIDELKQAQYRELHFMLLVMLIAALCSYGLAFLLRSFAMAPITQLDRHARRIAEQPDMSEPIIYSAHRADEISHLYDAFNLLMSRIQQRETEILQLNRDLEIKIRQRTQDLEESRHILALSLQASNQWLWDWNIADNILKLDAELVSLCTTLPPATITIDWFNEQIHPDDQLRIRQAQANLLCDRQPNCSSEFRLRTVNGDYRWIHSQGQIIERSPQGNPVRMIGTQTDITDRKQAEIELRIAAVAFESQEGIMVTDANNDILRVNQAFTKITGYTTEEAVNQNPRLLKSGLQDQSFYEEMWRSIELTGNWEGQIWNRRKNSDIYPELITITAVKGPDNVVTNYVAVFNDITLTQAATAEIERLAFYDPLTALPNRRLLMDRLQHSINMDRRDGKQLALLMLDLDRFKAVNDSLGHLAGDDLLQQVAARISSRLRDVDMVARLGGDEFVILLEDITLPEDAAQVAEEIIAELSKQFCLSQHDNVLIGASIGISLYPQHGDSPEILMDHADAALYQAKDAGRGCFAYFSEELTLAARERIALEARLRHAIEQQELRVFYQAQVDIATGLIIGAEALVRWQDPAEGLIPPQRFIPIAEESGLIVDIGSWVLHETCRQGRQWLDTGLPAVTLAVNVSAHQFQRSDICALVAQVLSDTGFPPEHLELEITESGLMGNQSNATTILNNLRAQGVHLAIDDFGTGYSSLAYLKHFPLDVLKIDKSFIDEIPFQQDDMEITATIVAMAHTLGFKVLAEGVETPEQHDFLRKKGCDMYQGYIKSPPIPAEEFAKLLRSQNRTMSVV
ncbi:bifunctional diguanylate cyclase/phosphodiesterase [Candidatus Methylobacter oryzae]|uniref:EAL domain-containing protein n=1 Tax=Candidatus Methylobacter oryzae TaxID=2497749 RepID=A0ABY3C9E4_9GAMM|nr:EAL domain-containing protein [Candidatus Methylobacter oryzae]TRW92672.1 EAL domain-containing protein [Candidatus Methylobacter oryzae]